MSLTFICRAVYTANYRQANSSVWCETRAVKNFKSMFIILKHLLSVKCSGCAMLCFACAGAGGYPSTHFVRVGHFAGELFIANRYCSKIPPAHHASASLHPAQRALGSALDFCSQNSAYPQGTGAEPLHSFDICVVENRQNQFSRSLPAKPVFRDLMPPEGGGVIAGGLILPGLFYTNGCCCAMHGGYGRPPAPA